MHKYYSSSAHIVPDFAPQKENRCYMYFPPTEKKRYFCKNKAVSLVIAEKLKYAVGMHKNTVKCGF